MKFNISDESEFYVSFPEDVGNIIGYDAECFWGNSDKYEFVLVSSVFDVLTSLKHAVKEVLSGDREVSEEKHVGNLGRNYNESNEIFLRQIEYGDSDLPVETKFGIWLGNDILTFIYSYQKKNYIEVSPSYPYFYTDEELLDFSTWMASFKSLMFFSVKERALESWMVEIDSVLDHKV